MDTVENRLAALMASDAPPARDAAFELAVMAGIERKRFRDELIGNAAIAALAGIVLFALAAPLAGLMQGVSGNMVAAVTVTLGVLWAMQWSLQKIEI
jgi:hypothetical protein